MGRDILATLEMCHACNFYRKDFLLQTNNKYVNSFKNMLTLTKRKTVMVATIVCFTEVKVSSSTRLVQRACDSSMLRDFFRDFFLPQN